MMQLDRRDFLLNSVGALGALSLGSSLTSMASARPFMDYSSLKNLGALRAPNAFGMRLPPGFTGQMIAQATKRVKRHDGSDTGYKWHIFPDGGACFETGDGGWIYASNSERTLGFGGAGVLRFDAEGRIIDAYSILSGTTSNCSGGPTPWSTWLSCEEFDFGSVFECDVYGKTKAVKCRGLGNFKHEAAAIDSVNMQAYLTEDQPDGCLYRYTPKNIGIDGRMNFQEGLLEVAAVDDRGVVSWLALKDPNPGFLQTPTRHQIKDSRSFNGGEGIWYHEGVIFFTTKGDNRVWSYTIATQNLAIVYDQASSTNPILSGVDNLTVTRDGHILVGEDGGDMQIVVLGPYGDSYPIVQLVDQDYSEITGPALNHLQDRLYFSSQKGVKKGLAALGATYQISGNFS